MEQFILDKDLSLMYVQAQYFPEGIKEAFFELEQKLATHNAGKRQLFGLSKPDERGQIIYKAAAEEVFPGEGAAFGLSPYLLAKGTYFSKTLADWDQDVGLIGATFQELLKHPELDPDSPCVERYIREDVQCMVRLLITTQ